MSAEDDEDIPLGSLNEIIWRFKKRKKIMSLLMALSLPATIVAILLFLVFTVALGFSSQSAIIFAFLVFSAVVSLVANLWIPESLSTIVSQMEETARGISFTTTVPRGENPELRILNQLIRTDLRIKSVVGKNPQSAQINVSVVGTSGKEHGFNVYIHNANRMGRYFNVASDLNVYVKRYEDVSLVGAALAKSVKEEVQDSLSKVGRKIPDRVLIVSTSGFDETAFKYAKSKNGVFGSRFSSFICDLELVKENVDGSFDVLTF